MNSMVLDQKQRYQYKLMDLCVCVSACVRAHARVCVYACVYMRAYTDGLLLDDLEPLFFILFCLFCFVFWWTHIGPLEKEGKYILLVI